MLKLAIERLPELFAGLSRERALYLPVEQAGQVEYGLWSAEAKVRLDALNTVKSAKDLFFPQSENLMAFKTQGKQISILDTRTEPQPFVIFGVRACDAASFDILDRVFLADPVDSYYAARREQGAVITRACFEPEESCFCGAFGIDALHPAGDIATWETGGFLYWDSLTDKGAALTEAVSALFEPAGDGELASALDQAKAIFEKLPLHDLSLEGFDGEATARLFDSPKWQELSQSCIGCGTCTFVCPTCQCYDIRDYDTGHGIQRFRCWDSCMYSDFTKMAHGNPRTTQLERFRQRFMHKLVYFPANNDGAYSCVGCGRCLNKCPISMNIVKVIKTLGVKEDV